MLKTPDYYYPSEPDYGVPLLLPDMQLKAPVIPSMAWGSQGRTRKHAGMFHFYVDDYRFQKVIKEPEQLVNTGCLYATEINPTVSLCHPRVLVLESIFWKRWVSRTWQAMGVMTTVDVNFPTQYADLCFLGVPYNWASFSTRGYSERLDNLHSEFAMCRDFSKAPNIVFMVFGGGQAVKNLCDKYADQGWVYIPDHMEANKGRFESLKPKVHDRELTKVTQGV